MVRVIDCRNGVSDCNKSDSGPSGLITFIELHFEEILEKNKKKTILTRSNRAVFLQYWR